jgi:RHS repeat-associated protein
VDKPTIESNLRLPGQYEDQETGLHYNYFRYMDTQTGRYITQDPIGLAGGINRFAYVNGNPINLFDPMGLAVYGDNGNNFGDIPPTENCRTPIWAGGYIMGWKPCNPPKPPNPRPPVPSPLGGSCEAPQGQGSDSNASDPNSGDGDNGTPSPAEAGGSGASGGLGLTGTVGGFAPFGCTVTAGGSYGTKGGGLSGYAGCGIGAGGFAGRGSGQASFNYGDPTGWGIRGNAAVGLFGAAASGSLFVTSTGINATLGWGQGSGGTANITGGYRGTR